MLRLRFPPREPRQPDPSVLPPELWWDAPQESVALLLSRRQFLRAAAVVLGLLALPFSRAERAWARARGRFFTGSERATLDALCDTIIPPDDTPGAAALGAGRYIDIMLSAFDGGGDKPPIYAGGPFSGRNPYPDNQNGTPSKRRPHNSFKHFVELTRLQELTWRGEILGTANVPELAAFDPQFGAAKKALRDVYRVGLAKVDQVAEAVAGAPFAKLGTTQQVAVFKMLDSGAFMPDPRRGGMTFIDLLIQHTLEGCFSVPEYGGNLRGQGWAMVGLEGDDQPLGYSILSLATGSYVERPDHPMSTPNPDELGPGGTVVPRTLTADGKFIQNSILTTAGLFGNGAC
jgi:hypothetical protein